MGRHSGDRRSGAMVARSTPNAEVPGSSPGCDFILHVAVSCDP